MRQDDYYQLLRVGRRASQEEVKRAFRSRIRDVHPDRCPDDDLANESARKLIEAYRTLTDPVRRKCYDHSLAPLVQPVFVPACRPAPLCYPRASRAFAMLASIALIIMSALLLAQLILADPRSDFGGYGAINGALADRDRTGQTSLFDTPSRPRALVRQVTNLTIPPPPTQRSISLAPTLPTQP